MDTEHAAKLLVKAANTFNERKYLALSPELQEEAARELHSFNLLSYSALAAIVGCSEWRVRHALKGLKPPKVRGKLNPTHIPTIAYMLSLRQPVGQAVGYMVAHGTDLSTLEQLTGISRSTLTRWRLVENYD